MKPDKRADVGIGPYEGVGTLAQQKKWACEQQLRPYRINGTSGANR